MCFRCGSLLVQVLAFGGSGLVQVAGVGHFWFRLGSDWVQVGFRLGKLDSDWVHIGFRFGSDWVQVIWTKHIHMEYRSHFGPSCASTVRAMSDIKWLEIVDIAWEQDLKALEDAGKTYKSFTEQWHIGNKKLFSGTFGKVYWVRSKRVTNMARAAKLMEREGWECCCVRK